ncbi:RNA-directed DNA polymerase [Croceicoccus estronivorus]|uniref:RNA-directed DNA polymerase n=1 Tax=Croceicoccus estronivorus TaxID=1172626 RepID=UPI000A44F206|nr:RNA-directed DNA polymerase [Croceicoccus estronivorus]
MQRLIPTLDQVSQEYVLVQAWKKTASYIRYHNWFSDTLELDRTAADLPRFISRLSQRLRSGQYETEELKLVPAPKSQRWQVDAEGLWRPEKSGPTKIRPLAHVALSDQVAATALMLCLSERVESAQGDPTGSFESPDVRRSVMSYGNRLFCDRAGEGGGLIHRWGSSKLYRAYFQDYRSFLQRPEAVSAALSADDRVLIVQTDLKQFYDRVTPDLLLSKVRLLQTPDDDGAFFDLAGNVLNWSWEEKDERQFARFKQRAGIPEFDGVALPQGLVAAGFFSNVVLLDFDRTVISQIGREVTNGVWLRDACRYVDDIRLTITTAPGVDPKEAQARVMAWLGQVLTGICPGLEFAPEKTSTASVGGEQMPLVRQSRKMERIQTAISGGFDAGGGEEVIQAIEALVRSQLTINEAEGTSTPPGLRAVPDVKDETVGRFAAGRFRKTFRSLRPLLDDRPYMEIAEFGEETFRRTRLSQSELDEEARAFALVLIERWIRDPSNVRLLRVALDLWPSRQLLEEVLKLFEPYLCGQIRAVTSRQVAYYCLAEIFRAGATETGFIDDPECLPAGINLTAYRSLLLDAAIRVATGAAERVPWYLAQQALLYIAVHDPRAIQAQGAPRTNRSYWRFLSFLTGERDISSDREFAIAAVVSRRSFLSKDQAVNLVGRMLTPERFAEVAARDIEFARDLFRAVDRKLTVPAGIAEDLGIAEWSNSTEMHSLQSYVQDKGPLNPLRNEIGVLSFAEKFIAHIEQGNLPEVVTPSTTQIAVRQVGNYVRVEQVIFRAAQTTPTYRSIYTAPSWAPESQRWRFQLGYLLRFILTARIDFSLPVRSPSWKEGEPIYRPTRGHWFQRQYGFYNGHEAFGDDWLPISQSTQDLLFDLLIWPGCRTSSPDVDQLSLAETAARIRAALVEADAAIGPATGTLMLKVDAPIPGTTSKGRPLRACVVQSVMPEAEDFSAADLEMNSPALRRKHRKHLSTALAAVEKMLDLRETHKPASKRLDWLILPELSVHPDDVATHLVPFARAFKTAILVGMAYEQVVPGQPLINSALWIIPRMVQGMGLQTVIRRQGKQHLSPMEQKYVKPVELITGFRPCQWLVGYEWSNNPANDALWLTASICYDATDLKLASDLRDRSDVFAIPALNLDVGTFDQMAQALHYHMFQLVLIANNGAYGGSNAHVPKGEAYQRQVFHTHGQPQATISFFEIDDIEGMKQRHQLGAGKEDGWKYPPAGCQI